jgi:arylsulfatase A-like enzyme
MIKGYFQHTGDEIMKMRGRDDNKKFPNIIFFASDGVEAAHLKTYGYHRDTVPNLNSLSDRFLLFENAFPNSGKTIISTTSLLTGKDPLATKVFSPSHLLEGKDAYEHLPGILKLQGYKTLQETVSYYADSSEINMRNAFDEANGVKISNTFTLKYFPGFLQSFGYEEKFLKKALGRAGERYLHLLGIRDIKDIYAQLVNEKGAKLKDFWKKGDDERINRAIRFMKQSSSPFFLHIHLMSDTHCRTFKDVCELAPAIKEYSKSRDATLDDQYDDAIKMSDRNFGRLINWLKANKKLDNTVIVYTSDHGRLWNSRSRVPLIFIFPDMKGPKTRLENVSLLDVAPTILDYIGLEIPSFMDGRSLLAEKLAEKPIFTVPDFNAVDRMTIPRI